MLRITQALGLLDPAQTAVEIHVVVLLWPWERSSSGSGGSGGSSGSGSGSSESVPKAQPAHQRTFGRSEQKHNCGRALAIVAWKEVQRSRPPRRSSPAVDVHLRRIGAVATALAGAAR